MKTQLEQARAGKMTSAMEWAASIEKVPVENIRDEIASGRAVLPANPAHVSLRRPSVVGRAFRAKVNANIGRSTEQSDVQQEMKKLAVAISAGADFVMDLSVGSDLVLVRKTMLSACCVPLGTVPIYEAVTRAENQAEALQPDVLMEVIREQAEQGVDFITLHAAILRRHLGLAFKRLAGIVSRGGSILAAWMKEHDEENPLYARWDEVLDICQEHDVTLSLGDGLRPGCLADASDEAQFAELETQGALVRRCQKRGVQVMVEGPGHIPFNEIQMNMEREHRVCDGAPFYVLGPVVTDVAPGYDHITSCIGATAAATYGASLLCYVTPAEHLGLPTEEDVKEGVMAYRIAAHAADVARGLPGARDWDDSMTLARTRFDWERQFELAMDGARARARFQQTSWKSSEQLDHCSMCGTEFCAMRISQRAAQKKLKVKKKLET